MDDAVRDAGRVLEHTPLWAYALLGLLVVLGIRRMRERATSLAGLLITPSAFLIWSLWSAVSFWMDEQSGFSLLIWPLALSMGLGSFAGFRASPMRRQGELIVRAATILPLLVYVGIFAFRYALEVWSALVPERRALAQALAVLVSGFMAGRTLGDFAFAARLGNEPEA